MSTNVAVYALTKLEIKLAGSTGSYAEIPSVKSISGPNIEGSDIEVTHQQSQRYKEYKKSPLSDPGTIDFTVDFNPSNAVHKLIFQNANSTASILMDETFADGTKYGMTGSFTSIAISSENPADSVLSADISYKISGQINEVYA